MEKISSMEEKTRFIDLTQEQTRVMGILNVTPDSFSDGGKFLESDKAIDHAAQMIEEGADMIDVGGESSRPGAVPVSVEEELERVIPVIQKLAERFETMISIDTTKAVVAREALKTGASVINDITALNSDTQMIHVIKDSGCQVILMHIQGTPQTMQENPTYAADVIKDIENYFGTVLQKTQKAGIQQDKIILDPGIGFGKTVEHNLTILRRLSELSELGYPIAIGVSRKSFIGKILEVPLEERLEGSLAAAAVAVWNGAKILRVHEVRETVRVVRMVNAIQGKINKSC
jgi:dihydropteroate synthase